MKQKNLFVLVGIPASGKSFYATNCIKETGGIHISRDNIRYALLSDTNSYFDFEPIVYKTWIEAIKAAIDSNAANTENIYVDATTLSVKRREELFRKLELANRKNQVSIRMKVFTTDAKTCIERNSHRTGRARVPEATIYAMQKNFQMPVVDELNFVHYDNISIVNEEE